MGDRNERELRIKEEIRKRLEGVCSNLTEAAFRELIDSIAANQLKRGNRPFRFESMKGVESVSGGEGSRLKHETA